MKPQDFVKVMLSHIQVDPKSMYKGVVESISCGIPEQLYHMGYGETTHLAYGKTIHLAYGETIHLAYGETIHLAYGEIIHLAYGATEEKSQCPEKGNTKVRERNQINGRRRLLSLLRLLILSSIYYSQNSSSMQRKDIHSSFLNFPNVSPLQFTGFLEFSCKIMLKYNYSGHVHNKSWYVTGTIKWEQIAVAVKQIMRGSDRDGSL
ncbi:hypothetical protein STEG23_008212 [Scotinomys teguina]